LVCHGMTKPPASSSAEWKARRFVGLVNETERGLDGFIAAG
jgi:hypothetical protein